MSLFLKRLQEITYDDVKAFCDAHGEGVRVEYKKEVANIPKTVSSFANTAGGIWIIGVFADSEKDKRDIIGVPSGPGYEERIVQSCLTGVYPPLRPDVRVLPMPDDTAKALIIIKVTESTEAPHAIENSTRAYIRTGSVSQPYELADMDRLEYMFKRREQAERKREELITRIVARSRVTRDMVRAQAIVSPTYPRVRLKTLDEIQQFVFDSQAKDHSGLIHQMRRVSGGMMSYGPTDHHLELNEWGVVFVEIGLHLGEYKGKSPPRGGALRFIQQAELIAQLYDAMTITRDFAGDNLLNITVRLRLLNCDSIYLARGNIMNELSQPPLGDMPLSYENVAEAETTVAVDGLDYGDEMVGIITGLLREISWCFNRSDIAPEVDVKEYVKRQKPPRREKGGE